MFSLYMRAKMYDRLSSLPDSLMQKILSLIQTKEAVRTSILSRRWREIWIGCPSININLKHLDLNVSKESEEKQMKFIETVLLCHPGSNIDKLDLMLESSSYPARINYWISTFLVGHNKIKDLYLALVLNRPVRFPASFILRSETLKRLKLCIYPRVEILASQAILSFPCLEEFQIASCKWMPMRTTCICAPNLRRLVVHDEADEDFSSKVTVDAPSITSLAFSGMLSEKYSLCKLSSLHDASLSFNGSQASKEWVVEFLRKISNVKELSLCVETINILHLATGAYPSLHFLNLSSLVMFDLSELDSERIMWFFNMLPNLESLAFPNGVKAGLVLEDHHIIAFTFPRLKALKIGNFHGDESDDSELRLIKHLAKNSKILEMLTLPSATPSSRTLDTYNRLSILSRWVLKFSHDSINCTIKWS